MLVPFLASLPLLVPGFGPAPAVPADTCPASRAATAVAILEMHGEQPRPMPKPVVGPRRAAVERILNVELARLTTALEMNWVRLSLPPQMRKVAPTSQEIADEMEARQPILWWAGNLWLKDFLGVEQFGAWCPTLKKLELHPWQWTPKGHPNLTPPTLVEALRALRPSLEVEIRKGFRSTPLRVARLAYRAVLVYLLAALSFLPGPTQPLIQRTWPRIVEHLATTLETNHKLAIEGQPPEYAAATGVVVPTDAPRRQVGSRVGMQSTSAARWIEGALGRLRREPRRRPAAA